MTDADSMLQDELDELRAIVGGDDEAFARWCARVELPLRVALRSFATRVDVEAVVQETLLRVWQVAPRFVHDGRPDALLRFAIRACRNLAISGCRRRGVVLVETPPEVEVAPITPDPKLREHVVRCREKLPDQPRRVLDRRLESSGDADDGVLAADLGMSLNTFLQNVTRARRFLRECLARAGVDLDRELV